MTTVRDQPFEVRGVVPFGASCDRSRSCAIRGVFVIVRGRVPFVASCDCSKSSAVRGELCAREGLMLSMPESRSGEFLDRLLGRFIAISKHA